MFLLHHVDLFSGEMVEDECSSRSQKGAVGLFGSFTAQLNNGIIMSLSTYGPSGQPPNGKLFVSFLVASDKYLITWEVSVCLLYFK